MTKATLFAMIALLATTASSAGDRTKISGPPANDLRLVLGQHADAVNKCVVTALVHNGTYSNYPGYTVKFFIGTNQIDTGTTDATGKKTVLIPRLVTATAVHATAQYQQSTALNSNVFTCAGTGN